jgi:transcriptional regulator with PAS, ATPase and Fis domain
LLELLPHEGLSETITRKLVGGSEDIELVRLLVAQAAKRDVPVLITGDTGTGKEVVARLIHSVSERSSVFVAINCAAIAGQLLESELFGHVQGAFTGATKDKEGLWKKADGGTLFLDEVGDLSPEHQTKVLRALEEGRIRKVGGEEEIPVDARIVAATNRPLCRMIERGQFREDLYYRLRALRIQMTPLRDHPEDIPLLAKHFWELGLQCDTPLSGEVLSALRNYSWPGNVRQLKSVLSTIEAIFGDEEILPEYVGLVLEMEGRSPRTGMSGGTEAEFRLHRARCLEHLRQSVDALRACEVVTRPLTKRGRRDQETVERVLTDLGEQLHQLSQLGRRPVFFGDEETFRAVDNFTEQLWRFREMLKHDMQDALALWESTTGDALKTAIGSVFEEVQTLTRPDTVSS